MNWSVVTERSQQLPGTGGRRGRSGGGTGHVHDRDCGDGVMGVYNFQNLPNHALLMGAVYQASYTE